MKHTHLLIISILCLLIGACSTGGTDSAKMFKGQSETKIFRDGKHALSKRRYEKAIQHFFVRTKIWIILVTT